MTVHERIAQAMQVIAETDFNKSGKVTGGATYNFIPIGQILQAIRKAHAKAGLFLTMGQLEYDKDNAEGVFSDAKWTKARGHCEVTIHGADGDCISFIVPFNVQDNSDKLDNKILTNIERQTYRLLYAIDEGDATDPEAEWHEDMVPTGNGGSAPAPEQKRPAKTSGAEKAKLIRKLTGVLMAGGTDADVVVAMAGGKLDDLDEEKLREIWMTVEPSKEGDL